MYTTIANIYRVKSGYRRLILDGHRFGELNTIVTYEANSPAEQFINNWRCTANVYNQKMKKHKRCTVRLKTKVIDGYEMIEKINVIHDHRRTQVKD